MKEYIVIAEFWSKLDNDWTERTSLIRAISLRSAISQVRKLYKKRVSIVFAEERK